MSFVHSSHDQYCMLSNQMPTIQTLPGLVATDDIGLAAQPNGMPNFMKTDTYWNEIAFYTGQQKMNVPSLAVRFFANAAAGMVTLCFVMF